MTDNKKVVLIGWNPEVLDTNNKPDNAPKNIMGALQAEQEKLHNLGYKASLSAYTHIHVAVRNARFQG